ncbi:MAG: nucleotide exchange factor GrpE [Anaerolineae bacterium]
MAKDNKDRAGDVIEEMVEAEVVEQTEAAEEEEATEERSELNQVRDELEEAEAKAAEYLDGWQRTRAEFSNYKKRQEADRAQMMTFANAILLRKLLPVLDDFERAMATMPTNLSQVTWIEGISLIKHKLDAVLESESVKSVETEGQVFDPRYHEAVTHEELEGYEDGQVIGEVQRGYILGERVLRPALVRVAKAPVPRPEEESEKDTDSDTTKVKE